jgi:16S rRNA (cytosine1402-N4)-methyltransferase
MTPSDPGGTEPIHRSVMPREVLEALAVRSGGVYLDGTAGAGGHAELILQASSPSGRLLALDRDPAAVAATRARLRPYAERAVVLKSSFDELDRAADASGLGPFDGILFDLGVSSMQLGDPARGMGFLVDSPLDMRMDPEQPLTAEALVNELSEADLARLLFELGEEPRSRRIARGIVAARPLTRTRQLADVVARASGYRRGRTHPATRTFMALRIAVNDELEGLRTGLVKAIAALAAKGRLVVISFHSLEDRIVKHALRDAARGCICPPELPACVCGRSPIVRLLSGKPITPGAAEIAANPRARSAKLRAAERIALDAAPGQTA